LTSLTTVVFSAGIMLQEIMCTFKTRGQLDTLYTLVLQNPDSAYTHSIHLFCMILKINACYFATNQTVVFDVEALFSAYYELNALLICRLTK
jgi:hypothetical protein